MRVLVIGGTVFLGRHIVEALLARGHDVTLFNRGRTGPELFPQVERVRGDRSLPLSDPGSLAALGERHFDAVVDPSGYLPREIDLAAATLADRTARYCLISSVSVYPGELDRYDESAPVRTMPQGASLDVVTDETYGPLKALSETAALAGFGAAKTHVVRPGLIVGPYDPTDRFTYWPVRVARGGEVLMPGKPSDPVQFIDVRDLAQFVVRSLELGRSGTDNATSPRGRFTLADVISSALEITRSDATFTWVPAAFCERQGLEMWSDLPVWAPPSRSVWDADTTRAIAAGLSTRDLEDTIAATLAWHASRGSGTLATGLSETREREALAAFRSDGARRMQPGAKMRPTFCG